MYVVIYFIFALILNGSSVFAQTGIDLNERPKLLVVRVLEYVSGKKEVVEHEKENFSYEESAAYVQKQLASWANGEIRLEKFENGVMVSVGLLTVLTTYLARAKYALAAKAGVVFAKKGMSLFGNFFSKLSVFGGSKYAYAIKYFSIGSNVVAMVLLDPDEVADATLVSGYLRDFEEESENKIPQFLKLSPEEQRHFLTEECVDYTYTKKMKRDGMQNKCERLEDSVRLLSATLRELLESYYSKKFEDDIFARID